MSRDGGGRDNGRRAAGSQEPAARRGARPPARVASRCALAIGEDDLGGLGEDAEGVFHVGVGDVERRQEAHAVAEPAGAHEDDVALGRLGDERLGRPASGSLVPGLTISMAA